MMDVEHRAGWLALSQVENLGSRRLKRLYTRFRSPEAIWRAPLVEIARLPTFNIQLAQAILDSRRQLTACVCYLRMLRQHGIQVVRLGESAYPERLGWISDPPILLGYCGEPGILQRPAAAVVGTRRPTGRGIDLVHEIAAVLVEQKFVVVSGLAVGIDQMAHRVVLNSGGDTVGIPGQDLVSFMQRPLAAHMMRRGVLVSEHIWPTQISAANLVRRNRLISGLACLVFVVEGQRGAWHAARFAQQQGKPVILCSTSAGIYSQLDGVQFLDLGCVSSGIISVCEEIRQSDRLHEQGKSPDLFQLVSVSKEKGEDFTLQTQPTLLQ